VERLDYLAHLGVNAVELLPVQEFNELEYYSQIPGSDEYRCGEGRPAGCHPAGACAQRAAGLRGGGRGGIG
jgi:hypothetical protein